MMNCFKIANSQTHLRSFFQRKFRLCTTRLLHSSITERSIDVEHLSSKLHKDGFTTTQSPFLSAIECTKIKEEIPRLFRGNFATGVYPDEWHYREGISLSNVTREMCNSWKSSPLIASIVLNKEIGEFISQLMNWDSVRLAQDDVIWKVSSQDNMIKQNQGIDTVGYHQDSAYISTQFVPYENNSVTVWFALDDVHEENGCLEYARGSHLWPILHNSHEKDCTSSDEKENSNSNTSSETFHSSDASSYRNSMMEAAALCTGIDGNKQQLTIKKAPVPMGHAVIHHQDVWHGSGPNLSTIHHRRALVAHYLRGDVEFRTDNNSHGESFLVAKKGK